MGEQAGPGGGGVCGADPPAAPAPAPTAPPSVRVRAIIAPAAAGDVFLLTTASPADTVAAVRSRLCEAWTMAASAASGADAPPPPPPPLPPRRATCASSRPAASWPTRTRPS